MQEVKIKRLELLEAVKRNRDTHRETFLKAVKGFRAKVILELDIMLKEAVAGDSFRTSVHLPAPTDHTLDYDRVVRMLEMSCEDIIEISAHEFDMYVMDNWNWKLNESTITSMYCATD